MERTGNKMKSLIWKADPWGGVECWDKSCPVCCEEKEKQICRSRNVVYKAVCQDCAEEGRKYTYIGETSRSLAERAGEHKKRREELHKVTQGRNAL